jgi:ribosomal protein S18 acetylase RimI-like enzyme
MTQPSDHGRALIQRWVTAHNCYIATTAPILGYAVLEYNFFEAGFVSRLYVHAEWRRRGVGAALMRHLASVCQTDKVWTSTNLSNLHMQALLSKLGYKLSGVLHDLDEGDPELVYVKYLR